jgi:alginate O-acetyltransferase complex protein AlgI
LFFNSIEFLVFFIFVISLLAIIRQRKFQHIILLAVSYFFFYFSSNVLITLLIFSTVLDFYVGKAIYNAKSRTRKKQLLVLSLAGNLGLLGIFKYADFSIDQFNQFANILGLSEIPLLHLVLPIGISFYTFQTISYTVDIFRDKLKPSESLLEFAIFVSFFPQLVAGPILRAKDFLPQLREKIDNIQSGKLRQIVITNSNLKFGITLMMMGFLKKMFFADNIAPLVNQIFEFPTQMDSFSIMLGAIAFGVQIYGDFSGYSDIAIGAAMIMGFKIPINFNRPYFATSPSDYWKRWHISLSSWLRDYLYIPLGGNRKSNGRTYFNLITVMFLGGLWHGVSWNYVGWGLLHGLYLVVEKIIVDAFPSVKTNKMFKTRTAKIISILIMQYCVFLAYVVFRVKDLNEVSYAIQKYIFWDFKIEQVSEIIAVNILPIILIITLMSFDFIAHKRGSFVEKISKFRLRYWGMFLLASMLLILFFYDADPDAFIYFRF